MDQLTEEREALLEEYWTNQVSGLADRDYFLRNMPGSDPGWISVELALDLDRCLKITTLCNQSDVLVYNFYATAIAVLLEKYFQQREWIYLSSCDQLANPALNNSFFLFKAVTGRDSSFKELFGINKSAVINALQFAQVDTFIAQQQADAGRPGFGHISLSINHEAVATLAFQPLLDFLICYNREDPFIRINFRSTQFDARVLQLFAHNFNKLIAEIVEKIYEPVSSLDMLSDQEKLLQSAFNNTDTAYPHDKTIVHLFQQQAAATPDNIALVCGDAKMTYRELHEQSNRIAAYLLQHHQVGVEDLVAINLPRDHWLIVVVLGIFKAGAAYIPLDPDYPADRLAFILEDSQAKLVIDAAALEEMKAVLMQYSAEDIEAIAKPSNLSYIIYTSGSTGRPKGVMIEHAGMLNHLYAKISLLNIDEKSVVVQNASACFDISVWQFFAALLCGGKVVIFTQELVLNPEQFITATIFHKPSIVELVPSYLSVLLDLVEQMPEVNLSSVRYLLVTGEELKPALVSRWFRRFPGKTLVNAYGPTEASDDITHYFMESDEAYNPVPVGRVVQNLHIYIVDEYGALCPIGARGDIYVSGVGVGRGYLNQPAKTAELFTEDPFRPEKCVRMYKTGDTGKWTPDGNIIYFGRKDDQLKLAAYRIEPGEIEHTLMQFPGINLAAVVCRSEKLVAYFVSRIDVDIAELASFLNSRLPAYMVPALFVPMVKLPLTPNGKIDKKLLPDPDASISLGNTAYIAPRNITEQQLAAIWQELLNRKKVGINDDFFALGGHSLNAMRLKSRIYKTFEVNIGLKEIFAAPVLRDLAQLVSSRSRSAVAAIEPVHREDGYPLSSSQRRLWILSRFSEGNIAYNMPGAYVFEGRLDRQALEYSFKALIARHEILRTVFRENEEGDVRQYILEEKQIAFRIAYKDLRTENPGEEKLKSYLGQVYGEAFDLGTGPLVRVVLYQLSNEKWILSFVMHHIISDGWSMWILMKELLENYNRYKEGKSDASTSLRIQYKDYAGWQQQQLQSGALEQHKEYWLQQFAGELPVTELPTDRPRPLVKTYNGGAVTRTFDAEAGDSLKELCRRQDCTLFMGLLAMVNLLLHRYTGQEDIIIGSPVAGREHADLEDQIGFYVNTLALRTRLNKEESFAELLQKIRQCTVNAYEHQSYPFDELVDNLQLHRDLSRNPLFDVCLVYQNEEDAILNKRNELDGLIVTALNDGQDTSSRFDLLFNFEDVDNKLRAGIVYNSDLYDHATVERMLVHLEVLMGSVKTGFAKAIGELEYITGEEKQTILTVFNKPFERCGEEQTIMRLFEAQVKVSPTKDALVCNEGRYSYEALNERAERLGSYLQQGCGISRGDRVAIMTENSLQLITAILATLKAGGAYVPIDPDYPAARRSFILDDTQSRVLITQKKYLDDYSGIVITEEDEQKWITASATCTAPGTVSTDLAYIMYTSGSTGKPKGVMIEQRGVVRLVKDCNYVQLTGEEVLLSTGSVSFDATTFEYWSMLLNGGRLVMSSRAALLDEEQLRSIITGNGVNMMWFTAGWLNQLVDKDPELFAGLKTIIAGGDKLSPAHIKKLRARYPGLRIINGYGPTENTTFSLTYAIDSVDEEQEIPIGKPIGRSEAYILDEQKRLCGIGVVGEICVGGEGLARGYLHNESLTKERFIKNPFKEGDLLYRTGDLGRWTVQGNILFRGRKDDQVKIRGYRVEPAETAQCLENHEQIESAVVQVRTSSTGEKELIAYIVSKAALDSAAIRQYLSGQLPAYMIPDYYIMLDELPLTGNGKVDKSRLPDPEGRLLSSGREYKAPQNDTEQKLVEIWQEILQRERIGARDDFFESGGNSIKVSRLSAWIHKSFDIKIELQDLFLHTILEEQAALIIKAKKNAFIAIDPAPEAADYPLSFSQQRLWVQCQIKEINSAYNIPGVYMFEGHLDREALIRSLHALIERHESLRTIFVENEQGEARQIIKSAADQGFRLVECDLCNEADADSRLRELLKEELQKPFDLRAGPLLRVNIYKLDDHKWVLGYVIHHIISDGWSMHIMVRELLSFYQSFISGNPPSVEKLNIQYKDFATWQRNYLNKETLAKQRSYWLKQFEGNIPVLELPGDKIRPATKTYNGGTINKILNADLLRGIKSVGLQQNGTLFMSLLTAVNILLYRYTRQNDIIIGSPSAGRDHAALEDQIGFYVNTLALRHRLSGEESFEQLLAQVKTVTLAAYENQSYPFDELVNELGLRRDKSRNPLFDVWVVLHDNDSYASKEKLNTRDLKVYALDSIGDLHSRFDLLCSFTETPDALHMSIQYNTDIFLENSVQLIAAHFEQLLKHIIQSPSISIARLSFLTDEEKNKLMNEWGQSIVEYPSVDTVVSLFEEQVAKKPGNTALVFENDRLLYAALNEKSNRLAHYLSDRYGLQPNQLVGIRLNRGNAVIMAMLAVLKSGAAYLPIDPDYPEERISYIVSDSGCRLVIDEAELEKFRQVEMNYSASDPIPVNKPDDLAYVIYTSGSTGKPKGVMIAHRSLVDYFYGILKKTNIGECEQFGLVSTIAADLGNTVIYTSLLLGGTLNIFSPADLLDDERLFRQPLDCLKIVPSHWKALQGAGRFFAPAKCLVFGGESLTGDVLQMLRDKRATCEVYNHYGPTETTIGKLVKRIDINQADQRIALGSPFGNTYIYILDSENNLSPAGVPGEICIGGEGLGRGYLNNPSLTETKFVPDPFRKGKRIYRTGDWGRWLFNGEVEFLGRIDEQVKIRGFRVELGEIENALQSDPVKAAVVLAKDDDAGEQRLIAYLQCSADLNTQILREELKKKLPPYMIPDFFEIVEAWPLTANGKTDKRSLPLPRGWNMVGSTDLVYPRNEVEEKLADIWSEILGMEKEKIGVKNSFFELGGHSLSAIRIVLRIHEQFNIEFDLAGFFNDPTIEGLAIEIENILWLAAAQTDAIKDQTVVQSN